MQRRNNVLQACNALEWTGYLREIETLNIFIARLQGDGRKIKSAN
jgi:hypothetical protein